MKSSDYQMVRGPWQGARFSGRQTELNSTLRRMDKAMELGSRAHKDGTAYGMSIEMGRMIQQLQIAAGLADEELQRLGHTHSRFRT